MDLSKPSDRERMIERIMRSEKVPYDVAVAFVDKTVVREIDHVTGQSYLVNVITGKRVADSGQQPGAAPTGAGVTPTSAESAGPQVEEQDSAWKLASTPRTTGVGPKVGEVLQSATGQVSWNIVSPEFTERRQKLLNMQNEVIRGVINNPRFPIAEQERIRKEISIVPSISTDPQTLLANIRSLDSTLRTSLANREREGADINLPIKGRQEALLAANEVRNLLKILGVPSRNASEAQPGQNNIGPAPAGFQGTEKQWEVMTPRERALWQN